MSGLFLTVLNMSITASCLIGGVLILRLLMKKAPKWASVLLWSIAAIRLVLPFSLESALSLVPETQWVERQPDEITEIPDEVFLTPDVITDTELGENVTVIHQNNTVQLEIREKTDFIGIFTYIWLGGGALMLLYAAVTAIRLHRKISAAVLLRDNIYQSEHIPTPFVLGIIKPRIYVPFSLEETALSHVIAHENAHIRRRDHIWKPLGFLILAVHWFNPTVWVGYILLCRDIEAACDEKVIKSLDDMDRADYSQALLNCSTGRRIISACPLAFGEVSVKERVKGVLSYKKPALWIILAAVIACVLFAVCFLTDPLTPTDVEWRPLEELMKNYTPEDAAEDGCVVFKGGELISGEETWNKFVDKTKSNKPASVRVYETWSDTYAQHTDYYVKELLYDGNSFRLRFYDWMEGSHESYLRDEEYKYLVHSFLKRIETTEECYLLADSPNVTAEGYWKAMISSVWSPEYDIYNHCHDIYTVDVTGKIENEAYGGKIDSGNVKSAQTFDVPDTILSLALNYVAEAATLMNRIQSEQPAKERFSVHEATLTELERIVSMETEGNGTVGLYRIGYNFLTKKKGEDSFILPNQTGRDQPYLVFYIDRSTDIERVILLCTIDERMIESCNTPGMLEHYGDVYTAAAMRYYDFYSNLLPYYG